MSRARFIAAARLELLAEVIHYNETEPGLGIRFVAAVEEAAARAVAFPRAGSPARSNTRRVFLKSFPFITSGDRITGKAAHLPANF